MLCTTSCTERLQIVLERSLHEYEDIGDAVDAYHCVRQGVPQYAAYHLALYSPCKGRDAVCESLHSSFPYCYNQTTAAGRSAHHLAVSLQKRAPLLWPVHEYQVRMGPQTRKLLALYCARQFGSTRVLPRPLCRRLNGYAVPTSPARC